MPTQARIKKRFDWRLPFCTGVISILIITALALSESFDINVFLYIFLVAPVVALSLLIIVAFKRSLSIFGMLVVYCVTSWFAFKKSDDIRTTGRWLLGRTSYKAELLRQPDLTPGELKHMEWDGWGIAGQETVVYLVYDPHDALSSAQKEKSSGQVRGIPCGISEAHGLERHWYAVTMYTNTAWNSC